MKELKKFIQQLPENGWWSSGGETYEKVAKNLLDKGLSVDEVKVVLSDLFYATTGEYGE